MFVLYRAFGVWDKYAPLARALLFDIVKPGRLAFVFGCGPAP